MLFWLRHYKREQLAGDLIAGLIVAMMLVPQGMAYALVAGLPPVTGLYASILPPVAYALFGSSMVQSVGPMAITSLMIGTSLAAMGPLAPGMNVVLAAQMALIGGVVLFACGILRLGFLSSFLSRPVMSGFTSGVAIVIAGEQLPLLCGALPAVNMPSVIIGLASLLCLWAAKRYLARALQGLGISKRAADTLSKLAPVAVVAAATLIVASPNLAHAGIKVVGNVPSGLPAIGLAYSASHWHSIFMPSLLIGFMVFLCSQSAAQTLAQKRRERLNTDYELLGLGAANLASAISGGFPVTGSISRSTVNYSAGANTPLATLISAGLLAVLLSVPAPWLSMLPLPALGATIIFAVLGMIDIGALRDAWRYDRRDAFALLATALGVLFIGVEEGVVVGIVLSLGTLIWRSSRPHIAVLGRIPGSEHFRNVERHEVEVLPDVLMLRIDAGLFFGNTDAIIGRIEQELLRKPASRHVLLVMSAANLIDMTGVYALTDLNRTLKEQGITLHFSEIKGPVMDHLRNSDLFQKQLSGKIFLSTAQAFSDLGKHGDTASLPVQQA